MYNTIERLFSFILVMAMAVIVGLQVLFRYVLNSPLAWSEELAKIILIWMVFWGSAVAVRRNEHLAVTVFIDRLPPTWRLFCEIITKVLVLVFLSVLTVAGSQIMLATRGLATPALGVSRFWVYIIVPLSCIIMFVQISQSISETLKKYRAEEVRK